MPASLFVASLYLISKIKRQMFKSVMGVLDGLIRIFVNAWSCVWLAAVLSRVWDNKVEQAYLDAVYPVGVHMFFALLLLLTVLPLIRFWISR